MRFQRGSFFKAGILFLLILSLVLNIGLLRSANKFNIDSLKWTIKSQFLKYKSIQNGKIPLLKHSAGGIDYSQFLEASSDAPQKELIKKIGSNFSIFGLGSGEGFSGLPKGLPEEIAKCAVKNGLDEHLYFVDEGKFGPTKAYVFYQSDLQTNSLDGKLISEGDCSVRNSYRIQKSVTSWVLSKKTNSKLKPDQLPAHVALDSEGKLVLVTRLGQLCRYKIDDSSQAKLSCIETSLDFSGSKKNTHFGVKSILLDRDHLYVAYAANNENCERLEIRRLLISAKFDQEISNKSLFKSRGCFNPETTELNAVGGRMTFSDDTKNEITFSLGNAEIWTGLEEILPNPNYGNIIQINVLSGRIKTISSGHRNPQGLCYKDGKLYSSEQGPDGGDEFNSIILGKNYGWPFVSFGMPYGEFVTGLVKDREYMSHESYEKPLISWVPAIAVGDLICPNKNIKGAWSKDFLLATLKDSSIRRLVLDSGAVRVDERIPLGFRIRDILVNHIGGILALTDEGAVIQLKLIDR